MKKRKYQFFVFLFIFLMLLFTKTNVWAADYTSQMEISGNSFEMPTKIDYECEDVYSVKRMSFGEETLGKLYICGQDITNEKYRNKDAYGITGNVSFKYVFDDSVVGGPEESWHLVKDKEKKVAGRKLDANISGGVVIVQKSYDDVTYVDYGNPICDFFNTTESGLEIFKSDGKDISYGVYYKILIAYETSIKNGTTLGIAQYDTLRHVEVYNFFVVENSGVISIHNISAEEELVKNDEYSQEYLKHGETLLNNSVTRDGFYLEYFTSSYYVTVKKDDEPEVVAKTNEKFTQDGLYKITVKTKLNKTIITYIYVFNGGEDKGYSTYFGENLLNAERVFREGAYPTYAKGAKLEFKSVTSNVPPLVGEVKSVTTGEIVYTLSGNRKSHIVTLDAGEYIADFYNGDRDYAGSIYHYRFQFNVIDEESAPCVNYNKLMSKNERIDLQTKHYEVAYQTTAGGYIFVCFSMESYADALDYARAIEARYIEASMEGGFYYKREDNPEKKVKYDDVLLATKISEQYAKKNVEVNYINPLDAFTYNTVESDLLNELESMSIQESIHVFPSEEEREKMTERAPYLNDFTFIQAADYDVVSVSVENINNGKVTNIALGKSVNEQLVESGIYKVVEKNKYGKSKIYEAYYLQNCNTESTWLIEKGGITEKRTISVADIDTSGNVVIDADAIQLIDIDNPYDEWAIATINAPGVYSFEIKNLISEMKNLELSKAGKYEILFIDRAGNSYTMIINISGNKVIANSSNSYSYTELFNSLHVNKQDVREDYMDLEVLDKENEKVDDEQIQKEDNVVSDDSMGDKETKQQEHKNGAEKKHWLRNSILLVVGIIFVCRILRRRKRGRENDDKGNEK